MQIDGFLPSATTALTILQDLARRELLIVKHTWFIYPSQPQPYHQRDVKNCFKVLQQRLGAANDAQYTMGSGLNVFCKQGLFEKLFRKIFIEQKVFPKTEPHHVPVDTPLPTLFIGAEKTQVRQIPLAEERPWPFKFLLELGGMIVCKAKDKRDLLLELRQYLNNHPQYRIKVHAEQWPTGEILIVTTWFQRLELQEAKRNVNVP